MERRGDRFRLDPERVDVDYWTFLLAVADFHHSDLATRARAYRTAVETYQAPLAVDFTGEWLIALRESNQRRYLEAVNLLAEHHVAQDPDRALELLEIARNLESTNEHIYCDIMKLQAQQGRRDAIDTTYRLLQTQLADIDAVPLDETRALHARLTGQP